MVVLDAPLSMEPGPRSALRVSLFRAAGMTLHNGAFVPTPTTMVAALLRLGRAVPRLGIPAWRRCGTTGAPLTAPFLRGLLAWAAGVVADTEGKYRLSDREVEGLLRRRSQVGVRWCERVG